MPRGVTLVAFYKTKPKALQLHLEACQRLLVQRVGHHYLPYTVAQVHATIVGLEGCRVNRKIRAIRGTRHGDSSVEIKLDLALAYLRESPFLPLQMRIGGFRENVDYGFRSQGESPHDRSFSLRDRTATTIGWPVVRDAYPDQLFQLRKGLEQFGILHKYHERGVPDNDLYFVLGHLRKEDVPASLVQAATREVRRYLSSHPLTFDLSADDLWVVRFVSPSLPIASSQCWQVTQMVLDQEFLLSLYDEIAQG